MDEKLDCIWWQMKAFSHKNDDYEEMNKKMVKEC